MKVPNLYVDLWLRCRRWIESWTELLIVDSDWILPNLTYCNSHNALPMSGQWWNELSDRCTIKGIRQRQQIHPILQNWININVTKYFWMEICRAWAIVATIYSCEIVGKLTSQDCHFNGSTKNLAAQQDLKISRECTYAYTPHCAANLFM